MFLNVTTEQLTPTNGEVDVNILGEEHSANSSDYVFWYNWSNYDLSYLFGQFRYKLDIFLWKYMSFVIVFFSFFGNFIVIIVLLQKRSRNFSTSVFITSLAFSDIFANLGALEGGLLRNHLIKFTYSTLDCKLRMFLSKASLYVSVWMLVFISIERALSVKIPLKVKRICTVKSARSLVLIVWVLSFAKAALNASMLYVKDMGNSLDCSLRFPIGFPYLYYIDLALYLALQILIPFPIILVCTILTISVLLQNAIRKSKSNKDQVKSVTVTLLLVNVVFLVSVTPGAVLELYFVIQLYINNYRRWTFDEAFYHVNLTNLLAFVSTIHHAFNFFIYFLSGSRFRQETKALLPSCIRSKTHG